MWMKCKNYGIYQISVSDKRKIFKKLRKIDHTSFFSENFQTERIDKNFSNLENQGILSVLTQQKNHFSLTILLM